MNKNNLKMYCLTTNPVHLEIIKKIGYLPVGLGEKKFSNEFLSDKNGQNISKKNPFYGEYTFHYWLWKNNKIKTEKSWIGFCQYRKFWKKSFDDVNKDEFINFDGSILKEIPFELNAFDAILGENFFVNHFKLSKFLKKSFWTMFANPSLFFLKSKRNIKFHFDMMHGKGNLDKAIDILDLKERADFRYFVNTEVSFNPHNMVICKNPHILIKYYESVFSWLFDCEKVFGFTNLKGFGLRRIYGFLAERYLSYWFKKYTKYNVLPIIFKDIGDFNYKDL